MKELEENKKNILASEWISLFGFLGFLGLITKTNGRANYFFFMLFAFFSWFWGAKLNKELQDERLKYNLNKASEVVFRFYPFLCFMILFFLDRNTVNIDILILSGTLLYVLLFIIRYFLAYYYDKIQEKNVDGFISNLRECRELAKLTKEDLANKLGIREETITKLEQNRYKPSLKLAMDISKELNIAIEQIFIYK